MASKAGRVKSLIARDVADIIHTEIRNPHIGMVSVNEVEVADDLSKARVFVSFFGAKYSHQQFEELKKTSGLVRSSLAKKLDIYKVPAIEFVYDDSFERAASLEEALSREEEAIKNSKKK